MLFGTDSSAEGLGRGSTVKHGNGYLNWGFSNGNYRFYLLQVDNNGTSNLELYPPAADSLSYFGVGLLKTSDQGLVGLSIRENLNEPSSKRGDFCLLWFDESGHIDSERIYGPPNQREIAQDFIQTEDGGMCIVGQTQLETMSGMDGQVYLVKTNMLGEVEWQKMYGDSLYESGSSLIQTSDGGFMILGWTRSHGSGQRDFYLIKVDSLGNEQWFETYGTDAEEISSRVIHLSTGDFILTGSGTGGGGSIGRVYKVGASGEEVWSKTYSYENNTGNNLHKTIEMWNGDLVSVGMTNLNSNSGWLLRTDSLGEIIWQREYDKNEYLDLFYNVLSTNDGGFLLSGQALNPTTLSQDAWLLKVDSVGCTYPNCIVGIDEEEKTVMVDVWPNPGFSDGASLQLVPLVFGQNWGIRR